MLPADRFPGMLEMPLGGSVYELLEERYDTRPKEAVERIEVVSASSDEALILDVAAGSPLLSITRTTTDGQDEPIEFPTTCSAVTGPGSWCAPLARAA